MVAHTELTRCSCRGQISSLGTPFVRTLRLPCGFHASDTTPRMAVGQTGTHTQVEWMDKDKQEREPR